VVAVKNANDTKGCGKQIIGDAQPVNGGRWDNGWIYSPEKRKNYDVELKPLSDGTLRVVGYAGTKLFSRTMIWTPAPSDMKRCDAIDAAAPAETKVEAAPDKAPQVPAKVDEASKPAPAPVAEAASSSTPSKVEGPSVTTDTSVKQEPAASEPVDAAAEPQAEGGEEPGRRSDKGGLNIGNLDLEKVLTRTTSGKCKLDLPWVKVQFDCERE
ncbi:MAG TPA: DUF2147 domain-containing protein, partial [Hyphomicrobium sp.]|nr:DUF2147 domain-containing protein [Hyphomicrobium sp.]